MFCVKCSIGSHSKQRHKESPGSGRQVKVELLEDRLVHTIVGEVQLRDHDGGRLRLGRGFSCGARKFNVLIRLI